MFIDLTAEQRTFRDELRAYFDGCLTAEQQNLIARDPFGVAYMEHCRRLGRDGMLGIALPEEYGGRGLGPVEQQIFANEIARAEVPYPIITLNTVAPTLVQYGTDEQKKRFLPRILAGECHFAIGYTEPGAGTDLAGLRTTAVRDGDHYVVNGQKIFTSGAHHADYIWLAARTDPEARKHKGISMLIADCADPGFSCTPIVTMDGRRHTNSTYYQDVRGPVDMLVGTDLLNWQVAANQGLGWLGAPDASATKIYGSERMQDTGRIVGEVLARYGDPADEETQDLIDRVDRGVKGALVLTFGGGVNEIQREIIAMIGLGLPRAPR
jgi:alkylation response protein AidB-like acyl-CoA dehydrogenase